MGEEPGKVPRPYYSLTPLPGPTPNPAGADYTREGAGGWVVRGKAYSTNEIRNGARAISASQAG
jgi:hypothetical protein